MFNSKKLYINGYFPTSSFNLFGYWNTFMYKIYKKRNTDLFPFFVSLFMAIILTYIVTHK